MYRFASHLAEWVTERYFRWASHNGNKREIASANHLPSLMLSFNGFLHSSTTIRLLSTRRTKSAACQSFGASQWGDLLSRPGIVSTNVRPIVSINRRASHAYPKSNPRFSSTTNPIHPDAHDAERMPKWSSVLPVFRIGCWPRQECPDHCPSRRPHCPGASPEDRQ